MKMMASAWRKYLNTLAKKDRRARRERSIFTDDNGGNKMESQSRYSIVERLTNKKLQLLEQESKLDEEIKDMEAEIAQEKEELKNWKANKLQDIEKEAKQKAFSLTLREKSLQELKASKPYRMKGYEKMAKELDNALIALKDVARNAPSPEDQA